MDAHIHEKKTSHQNLKRGWPRKWRAIRAAARAERPATLHAFPARRNRRAGTSASNAAAAPRFSSSLPRARRKARRWSGGRLKQHMIDGRSTCFSVFSARVFGDGTNRGHKRKQTTLSQRSIITCRKPRARCSGSKIERGGTTRAAVPNLEYVPVSASERRRQ